MRLLSVALLATVCLALPAADGFSFSWTADPDNMKLVGADGKLGGTPWPVGSDVGFTLSFNAADDGNVDYGYGGAIKINILTMHPYCLAKPSNTIRWKVLQ